MTRYSGRPCTERPAISIFMRPFERDWICSSVHPIAYVGMCGKLPSGCPACVPSGRFAAASGSGVPHHGGPT